MCRRAIARDCTHTATHPATLCLENTLLTSTTTLSITEALRAEAQELAGQHHLGTTRLLLVALRAVIGLSIDHLARRFESADRLIRL
jgi:hypothetical protein